MGLVYAWENRRQGRNSGEMGGNTEKRKTNPTQRRRGRRETRREEECRLEAGATGEPLHKPKRAEYAHGCGWAA